MNTEIAFAVIAIVSSIFFIKLIDSQRGSGFLSFFDGVGDFLLFFVSGLPLTLVIVILFAILTKVFGVEIHFYDKKPGKLLIKTAVVIQWVIWSQVFASLFLRL